VPGWDCHGLPIELKAVDQAKSGSTLSPTEIRAKAHACAEEAIAQQMKGFRSWGVMGEWNNPYATKGTTPTSFFSFSLLNVASFWAASRSQVRSIAARLVPRPLQEG
jgi:hypothetical protein